MRTAMLVFTFLFCFSLHAASRNGPKIGDKPPLLQATKLLQAPPMTKLDAKSLRGKVVVMEFWATWCGPCVAAIPHLNELSEKFEGQPVQFLAITDEEEAAVKPFLKKRPIKAWIALDTDKAMHKAYGVVGIPHTVIVGKDGIIAGISYPGSLTEQHINDLLAGRTISLRESEGIAAARDAYEKNQSQPLFQVLIRRSGETNGSCSQGGGKLTARGYTVLDILPAAFDQSPVRIQTNTPTPSGRYDFIVTQPACEHESVSALLQAALKSTFKLVGRKETREMNVLLLKLANPEAARLVVSPTDAYSMNYGPGKIEGVGVSAAELASALESVLKKPVIDETALTNRYDISLKWDEISTENSNSDDLTKILRAKMGLELIATKRPMETVVIEKQRKDENPTGGGQ